MRSLFTAMARVFGLIHVYNSLAKVISLLPVVEILHRTRTAEMDGYSVRYFGPGVAVGTACAIVTAILALSVAWFLLFRTEWLAEKLGVPSEPAVPTMDADVLLEMGVRLLGIFVVVQAVPDLLGQIGHTLTQVDQSMGTGFTLGSQAMRRMLLSIVSNNLVASVIRLVLGIVLVFKTDSIVRGITRRPYRTRGLSEDERAEKRLFPPRRHGRFMGFAIAAICMTACVLGLVRKGQGFSKMDITPPEDVTGLRIEKATYDHDARQSHLLVMWEHSRSPDTMGYDYTLTTFAAGERIGLTNAPVDVGYTNAVEMTVPFGFKYSIAVHARDRNGNRTQSPSVVVDVFSQRP